MPKGHNLRQFLGPSVLLSEEAGGSQPPAVVEDGPVLPPPQTGLHDPGPRLLLHLFSADKVIPLLPEGNYCTGIKISFYVWDGVRIYRNMNNIQCIMGVRA